MVAQDDAHRVGGAVRKTRGVGQGVEPEHRAFDQGLEGAGGHLCLLRVDRCDTRSNALFDCEAKRKIELFSIFLLGLIAY